MFRALMKTQNDLSTLILRLAVGAVMWPHGAQKALGMYDGAGIEATVDKFQKTWGIDPWMTYCVIAAEFLGAIGLLLGCFTRVAALGIVAVMAGAIHHVHGGNGFFLSKGGYEYVGLIGLAALTLVLRGGGALSIDRAFSKRGAPPA